MGREGHRFRQARESLGWSRYQAAQRIGVGHQTIANVEDGVTDPSRLPVFTVVRYVEALWPTLALADFIGPSPFTLERREAS